MRKTSVESNERLLEQAREVINKDARRQEIQALAEMDGLDLSDPEVMARAWRSKNNSGSRNAAPDHQERSGADAAPSGSGEH